MSFVFNTQGFVLKKNDYTETSYIYTIYTKDFGKLNVICRGSKKLLSKLSPHLESFDLLDFNLVQGKTNITLIGVHPIESFRRILLDYKKTSSALFCQELIDKTMKLFDKDEKVFNLLVQTFRLLNENGLSFVLIYGFIFKVMIFLGFLPNLYQCQFCQTEIIDKSFFSIKEGSVICDKCVKDFTDNNLVFLDKPILFLLRLISKDDLILLTEYNLSEKHKFQFSSFVKRFFVYHIDCKVKSFKFLKF